MSKKYNKKRFTKFKKSFKKKRSNGFRSKRSILVSTTTRVIESSFPVYIVAGLQTGPLTTGFLGLYALFDNAGSTTSTSTRILRGLGIPGDSGYSREFTNMARIYTQCRLKSVTIQYINTSSAAREAVIYNAGPMSLSVTPQLPPDSGTVVIPPPNAAFNNFTYDGNLYIMPLAKGKSKRKIYTFPNRSLNTTAGVAVNDWITCTQFQDFNVPTMTLNIGNAPTGANNNDLDTQTVMTTQSQTHLIGSVLVKCLIEFAVPQTTN